MRSVIRKTCLYIPKEIIFFEKKIEYVIRPGDTVCYRKKFCLGDIFTEDNFFREPSFSRTYPQTQF